LSLMVNDMYGNTGQMQHRVQINHGPVANKDM